MPDINTLLYEGARIPLAIVPVVEVELETWLGGGGFGLVWRVRDVATGTLYALKIIRNIDLSDEKVRELRLADRVRLEAGVNIPSRHIIKAIGLHEWDPQTYLILFEYFPGTSLDSLLESGTLTVEQKKDIYCQALQGVSDAHCSNVIHRDLKPGNILLGDDGLVKVIDFGISKFGDKRITRSGQTFGTLAYMAPELLIHGSVTADARTDIYAMGQILYEMETGKNYWRTRGWVGLEDLADYMAQTPTPTEMIDLREFRCTFFPDANPILSRMVRINPEERYATVAEVMADLGVGPKERRIVPSDLSLRSPMLIVESGPNRHARTVLGLEDGERREIGRMEIAGEDRSISRRHLEFSRSGDNYLVRDLGSTNGTLLRGVLLDPTAPPQELYHGDRIKVGDIFLRFAFLVHEASPLT